MDKTSILVYCSTEFKEAAGTYAQNNDMSLSELIRDAVAKIINYDLTKDTVQLGRKRKWDTDEDRINAQREKAKTERQLRNALLDAYKHDEHIQAAVALHEYLTNKGITPNE